MSTINRKGYIVRRELTDNGPMGSTYAYFKVDVPRPGERIYHGRFEAKSVYGGQHDAKQIQVWNYVGEGEPTSEIWGGDGHGSVEDF